MSVGRREVMIGGPFAMVALGVGAGLHRRSSTPRDTGLIGLVAPDADLLILAGTAADGGAIGRSLGTRTGRTVVRAVHPLARDGFGDLTALIGRASGVHILATIDAAGLLVVDRLLQRKGATPVWRTTSIGDLLIARL